MKHTLLWLAASMALTCALAAQAADNKTTVIRDYTDTVAPADQEAYEAGTKAFNQCLGQHGFKYTWTAWVHETGDTYSYSYTSDPLPWSAFDAMREAGKACDAALRTNVNPHLKSETSAFLKQHPELSYFPGNTASNWPLIEVIVFKLKPGHEPHEAFVDVLKKIAEAAQKAKWPNHYIVHEVMDAGDDAPDFLVVLPAKSWADLGKDPDTPLWTMVESAYGKADAQAMRKSLNEAMLSESAHVDSYSAELTYKAGK